MTAVVRSREPGFLAVIAQEGDGPRPITVSARQVTRLIQIRNIFYWSFWDGP